MIDRFEGNFSFVVTAPITFGGVVDLPMRSTITRVSLPVEERTRASASRRRRTSRFGQPSHGPAALSGDWQRFWHLTFNIAVMQWKVRFYGSALGYLWQLVRPLLLFLVLYVFFTQIAHIGKGAGASYDDYGAQLLGSIVLFTFFAEATTGAVAASSPMRCWFAKSNSRVWPSHCPSCCFRSSTCA